MRRSLLLAIAGVLAVVVAVLVLRDRDADTASPPRASTSSSATTSESTTSTSTSMPGDDVAVFPHGDATFDDPIEAARAFAIEIGFRDPELGEYRAGDARSGEVEVRPRATGPATTVLVRQLGTDGSWSVLGSASEHIDVTEPAALDAITSPVRLRGRSTAFEGNVTVELRQDGAAEPIGMGWVTGGAGDELQPFDGTLDFSTPSAESGLLMLTALSMEDGSVWEASVMRVHFAERSACGGLPAVGMPEPDQMVVRVFYTCEDDLDGEPVQLHRIVPRASGVLRASLEQLLAGPTDGERAAGFTSWFSASTAGALVDVTISGGDATVDLTDLRSVIPNASASAGSQLLLSQLDATVFQHPTVRSVIYRIEGDCEAFTEWLQLGGCEPRRPA